jgi:hypothetical protein
VAELRAQQDLAASLQKRANDLSYLSNNFLLYREQPQADRWNTVYASMTSDIGRLEASGGYESVVIQSIRSHHEDLGRVFADVVAPLAPGAEGQTRQPDLLAGLLESWRCRIDRSSSTPIGSRNFWVFESSVRTLSTVAVFTMMLFGVLMLSAIFLYRRLMTGMAVFARGRRSSAAAISTM